MKILLLTYEYPPFHGGVGVYLEALVKAAPPGVEISVDMPPKGEHWVATCWRSWLAARKRKCDLMAVSHVLPVGYVAWQLKLFARVPYVVFTHGTDILSARKNFWKRFWMRFLLKRAKLVVANSRFTAGLLKEEGITEAEIVPPGISVGPHQPPAARIQSRKMVSIGRLVARKGFDAGIRALAEAQKEFPDASYTIIGKGPLKGELEKLIGQLKLEGSVQIVTDADDAAKRKLLDDAAVFVLPARRVKNDIEGFGIVTLEAALSGLPVVVGRSGGAPEAVIDGVTGFIVEPDDQPALNAAVAQLFRDPPTARKMGEEGRKYVADEYSIDKTAKRFWDIVKNSPYPPLSQGRGRKINTPPSPKRG